MDHTDHVKILRNVIAELTAFRSELDSQVDEVQLWWVKKRIDEALQEAGYAQHLTRLAPKATGSPNAAGS